MPFIVTTSHAPEHDGATGYIVSVVAVATLEEAARIVHVEAGGEATPSDWSYDRCLCKTESGGTVGPLPDGTTIEVEPRDLLALMGDDTRFNSTEADILAAFNAREAGHGQVVI